MKNVRIVSIILLITLFLSCFAACNTSDDVTNETPTTEAPTTKAPSNEPDDDKGTTTEAPTTEAPTTEDPTTEEPTTEEPTTEEPTTEEPTTEEPTTEEPTTEEPTTDNSDDPWAEYDIISIDEALEICDRYSSGTASTERYYVRGTIKTILNASFGEMIITDGTNELYIYGSYGADGVNRYPELDEKPYKDDEVLLYCTLQNYNGSTKQAKSAWIIDFIPADIEIDDSEYTAVSIDDARNAAVGEKLSVTGVVAAITYSNGMIPAGVILVDHTHSIYIYSSDIAQRVSVGNTITVLGTRENWILSTEASNAQKFGYNGCCQLTDCTLAFNDNGNTAFDTSWIRSKTVKEILDTPVSENITTIIYKVDALVKKVPGNGFTNYYFYDIDGKTGAYTYTQCNGSDFAWLDAFDGKICTVYLTALNAKSTATDCYFRFVPVKVVYNNYEFNKDAAAEYAVKYHGVDQFLNAYSGDPALELVTNVDSELLGFTGATLSYLSSNEDLIYFTVENGKTIMHCQGAGKAIITITGCYNEIYYDETLEIVVTEPIEVDYVDVKTAIEAEEDEIVYVKGIVGPSIVNKSGFYLIDETGVIAVMCPASQFEGLQIGHEVIIMGRRENHKDDTKSSNRFGQTCIMDAEIVANFYGNHDYSTATFGKITVSEFYDLDVTKDYTTSVFYMDVKISVEETTYYTNIHVLDPNDDSVSIRLYCSNASQYSWLQAFAGETITVEIVPCNWNDKNYYTGCVLSVITEDGRVYNQLNFTTKI